MFSSLGLKVPLGDSWPLSAMVLILRIHYPLPLPYQGKPDPVVLQGIIRSLKEELGRLRGLNHQDPRDTRDSEIWHLREQ